MASFTDQQLLIAINNLPEFGEVTLDNITRLLGGQCNINIRVGQGAHWRVVRFLSRREIANPIDRSREYRHQQLAASHHLAPRPLAYYSVAELATQNNQIWSTLARQFSAVIVAEYCAGTSLALTSGVKSTQIAIVASLLAKLHQLPEQSLADIREQQTLFTRLKHYWQLFCRQHPEQIAQYDAVINRVLIDCNNLTTSRRCLIHGDVNPGNIIIDQQQMRLIDWEYSDYDDPYIDLASTIVELELAETAREDFITSYSLQCGEVSEQRLMIVESYYCALCWLWSQLHHSQSDDLLIQQATTARSEYYYRRLWRNFGGSK